jgi:formylglycine-generating enzyme required for sulfatase activity
MNGSTGPTIEFQVVTVDRQGKILQRESRCQPSYTEPLNKTTHLVLVAIPPGQYCMGAAEEEEGYHRSQGPQHQVSVAPFWMSQFPITQAQWEAVAALPKLQQSLDPYPSNFIGQDLPIEQVSWYEAQEFCDRLSQFTRKKYRLPSEAEWEYACRGDTQTPFHFGPTITTDLANYSGVDWEYQGKVCNQGAYGSGPLGEDRRQTMPVGSFAVANTFGLYDLHGNVREWCADPWHRNYFNAPQDDRVWIVDGDEQKRVLRGGSWNVGPQKCRSGDRARLDPNTRLYDIGFRIVGTF